jgi:hypothetical protein
MCRIPSERITVDEILEHEQVKPYVNGYHGIPFTIPPSLRSSFLIDTSGVDDCIDDSIQNIDINASHTPDSILAEYERSHQLAVSERKKADSERRRAEMEMLEHEDNVPRNLFCQFEQLDEQEQQ